MNQQLPKADETHLYDYMNVIIRRKTTLTVTFFSVVAAVLIFIALVPPSYESTATLFVKDDKGKVGQMGDLLLNQPATVDSELEILKSRSNAEKVVSAVHLDWKVDNVPGGVKFKIIEFSSSVKAPIYHVELAGNDAYTVKDDDGNLVGAGRSGVLMRGKGLSLLIKDLQGAKGESFRLTLLPFNKTVENLRKKIRAAEVGKKTNVIGITYRNKDPKVARDVVNTLVQAYLEQGVALKAEEATRTVVFVEDQLKGVKEELEGAEKQLQAYKSATGVIQLDAEAQNLIESLAEAEKQKAQLILRGKQAEFALASLQKARTTGKVYSPSLADDNPVLAGMATKLSELEVQKKGLLADSTDNHPAVKVVQAQIDEQLKKIQATYDTALRNTQKQQEAVSRQIQFYDAKLKKLPVAERDLARLMRINKVNSDIYTFLLQKHEEAKIAKASTINNITIVDPAIIADEPAFPKTGVCLVIGVIVGAMFGLGLCFFREYLDDTLKDPESVGHVLAVPFLALVPFISGKEGEKAMVAHHAPKSPASESFRTLRTALHFCGLKDGEKQVTLVTSTLPGEGKSTVACNLAITLAQTGARVLILDCDLRRSSLHEKFGFNKGVGLTELLAGDLSLDAVLHATSVEGLDLIKAGTVPPNPSEMLGSQAMLHFLEEMRREYTHIVIDAPPALAVTDAVVLTQLSDLVLVVVEAGRVPLKAAQRTRHTLMTAAAPTAGFVISNRDFNACTYGYSYGYGYGDGYDKNSDHDKRKFWLKFGR